jgi:ectoine hydroxylase-related dioxygenase (phytanoyl-CoA dioxygenase family)
MQMRVKTADDPALAETLEADGVVFVEGILDGSAVAELRARLDEYRTEVIPTIPKAHPALQEGGAAFRDLELHSAWFKEFFLQTWPVELARKAVPWEPVAFYLEAFPKPPGAPALVPHQDLYTAPVEPPQFLHMWIPLVDITRENGGITFYPGTHKLGLAPHVQVPGLQPAVHPDIMAKLQPFRLDVTCPAGTIALFTGAMVHESAANTSDGPRPALVIGLRGKGTVAKTEAQLLASQILRLYHEEAGAGTDFRPDQDFTALAGAGAAAERIRRRLGAEHGIEVTAAELFEHPTAAALAARILRARDAAEAG